jgi:hypothetical protein
MIGHEIDQAYVDQVLGKIIAWGFSLIIALGIFWGAVLLYGCS